jgi:hypothetical protein
MGQELRVLYKAVWSCLMEPEIVRSFRFTMIILCLAVSAWFAFYRIRTCFCEFWGIRGQNFSDACNVTIRHLGGELVLIALFHVHET